MIMFGDNKKRYMEIKFEAHADEPIGVNMARRGPMRADARNPHLNVPTVGATVAVDAVVRVR